MRSVKITTTALILLTILLLALAGRPTGATVEASGGPVGDSTSPNKQIAAPPSDFANLQLPNPADLGIRSHSAFIPVQLSQIAAGQWRWTGELRVDDGRNLSLIVLAPQAGQWTLTLTSPGKQTVALNGAVEAAGITHQSTTYSFGEAGHPADLYTFAQAETGLWNVQVDAPAARAGSAPGPDGYLLVASQSPYQLYAHLNTHQLLTGRSIGLVAYAYNNATGSTGRPAPTSGLIQQATLRLTDPNGQVTGIIMSDSGQPAGTFAANFTPTIAGNYLAQVVVTGLTPAGQPFHRTTEHTFPVIAPGLSLGSGRVQSQVASNTRLTLNLPAQSLGILPANVTVSAEVWATQNGQAVPVAWISGLVTPQQKRTGLTLPLSLDGRWITLAAAQAPYELRNVRVQDTATHIPLSQAATLPLDIRSLPANIEATTISDDMLMGVRPAASLAPEGVGHKLMLVHGYCSGGVWPTSQFTQAVTFLDANQNRSHDQFANLIRNYGNQFESFGIVAHSQGGAAALHLYTYYWSGLDYSSGNRLIQSVGTPYQGTALAGNAAALGQIFGIGCGTNFDLTYNGASLWLSGIPSWARSRVYFHTTSFTDNWWSYDYCHLVSDLLLSDPDDGTTEKSAGYLSSANNMGHKTGWCHTTGMRDPAQYNDSSRNANMNANANR